jgi:pimeloyl-ACP methyl ester carboxylesterase
MTHPAIRAARALGWSSTLVPVGEGRIHLVRHGRGVPLLFLHGWPEFWLTWRPLIERLADRSDCLAPDLRGFGATGKWEPEPSWAIGPDVHARHLVDLLDRLGIERVVLVGHDVGAYVAQATARLAPEHLFGIFLMDCPHPGIGARWAAPRQIAEIWYQSFNQQPFAARLVGASKATCRAYLGHFLRHWAHRKDVFEADLELWVDVFLEPGNLEGGFDWYRSIAPARLAAIEGRAPALPPIDVPTRVLWGRHDPILRAEWADTLPATFRDLELGFAEHSGHFPHREEPDVVAATLRAFLDRLGLR